MSVGVVNKTTGERIQTAGNPLDKVGDLSLLHTSAKSDAVEAINEVADEVATKQDAEDNSLDTEAKTIVGAINEHEGDIDSLKSGLINYRTQNDLNLEVPDRKNVLPLTLSGIKAANFREEWVGNVCTIKGVTYTIQTDSNEIVTEITSNGTATGGNADLYLYSGMDSFLSKCEGMVLNGSTGGSASTYGIGGYSKGIIATTGDVTITSDLASAPALYIRVNTGITVDTTFKPMIRPATITDATFAPYIPSVESRIEGLESGLTNVESAITPVMPSSNVTYIPFGNCVAITGSLNGNDDSSLPLGIPTNYYGVVMGRFTSTGKMSLYYVDSGYLRGWDGTTNRTFPSTDAITIHGILTFTQ